MSKQRALAGDKSSKAFRQAERRRSSSKDADMPGKRIQSSVFASKKSRISKIAKDLDTDTFETGGEESKGKVPSMGFGNISVSLLNEQATKKKERLNTSTKQRE